MTKNPEIRFFLFSLFLFFILFSGCSKKSNPLDQQGNNNSGFITALPGSWWKYDAIRYIHLNPDSIIKSEVTIYSVKVDSNAPEYIKAKWKYEVTDSVLKGQIFQLGNYDSLIYIAQKSDSIKFYASTTDKRGKIFYLKPLVQGRSWSEPGILLDYTSTIDSVADINLPSGLFNYSFHIKSYGGYWQFPVSREEWINEAAGLLQLNHMEGGFRYSLKLNSFHIVP